VTSSFSGKYIYFSCVLPCCWCKSGFKQVFGMIKFLLKYFALVYPISVIFIIVVRFISMALKEIYILYVKIHVWVTLLFSDWKLIKIVPIQNSIQHRAFCIQDCMGIINEVFGPNVVGWGTVLQTGRSRVQVLMRWIFFQFT
jgi:hypothetical protein